MAATVGYQPTNIMLLLSYIMIIYQNRLILIKLYYKLKLKVSNKNKNTNSNIKYSSVFDLMIEIRVMKLSHLPNLVSYLDEVLFSHV